MDSEINDYTNTWISPIQIHDGHIYAAITEFSEYTLIVLKQYTLDGALNWKKEIPAEDFIQGVNGFLVDDTGIYLTGYNIYSLSYKIYRLSHDGEIIWQFNDESAIEAYRSIAGDATGIYVAGSIKVNLTETHYKPTLSKFDHAGVLLWSTEFSLNTEYPNYLHGKVLAANGKIYFYPGYGRTLYSFDSNGRSLPDLMLENHLAGMAYDQGILYLLEAKIADEQFYILNGEYWLKRITPEGNAEVLYHYVPLENWEMHATANNSPIYIEGGRIFTLIRQGYYYVDDDDRFTLYINDLDGNLITNSLLPTLVDQFSKESVVAADGRPFVGAVEYWPCNTFYSQRGFLAEVNTPDLENVIKIAPLGNLTQNGSQAVAILKQGRKPSTDDPLTIDIISLNEDGSNVPAIKFTSAKNATASIVISDLNGNAAPEIAVLAADDPIVEIRDALTGEQISLIDLPSSATHIGIKSLADVNGNATGELAVLSRFSDPPGQSISVYDSVTAQQLSRAYFNAEYTANDFAPIADLDGDGQSEFAVLAMAKNNTGKVEIRTQQGALLKNIWLGKRYSSSQLVNLSASTDINPVVSTYLGVLQTKLDGSNVRVQIIDPVTSDVVNSVSFNSNYAPATIAALPNINAGTFPYIALLGNAVDKEDSEAINTAKIEIRNANSSQVSNNLWYGKSNEGWDMAVIPDMNNNGAVEIAALIKVGSEFQLIVKDSLDDQLIFTRILSTD